MEYWLGGLAGSHGDLDPPRAPAAFASSPRMRGVGCGPGAEDSVGSPRCPHGVGLWAAAAPVCVGGL